jgi:aminomethyltransferase
MDDSRRPMLHGVHDERGADFTDFGGWAMPVEFDGIRAEHEAVRDAVGKFDVSHMGEIHVSGPDAAELLSRLTTRDVTATEPGQARYGAITDDEGVMLDDTVVTNLPQGGPADFLFVPNAGHDAEMYDRWVAHREEWGLDADVENVTDDYAMFAVQGPDAEAMVADVAGEAVADLGRFRAAYADVAGARALVSRTGYTGEDGVELVVPADDAEAVWAAFDCQPCGLGARDTLRIEAGFLLSGQDFDPADLPTTPLEAGIDFGVDLDHEFVGRAALAAQDEDGVNRQFVGVALEERGVPRNGYPIETPDGEEVGVVTSGTMSPTLDEPIGLGYVPPAHAEAGTEVRVVVRGQPKRARIETPRFVN